MDNETLRIIHERRSVRKYKPINVSSSIIMELLDAGRMAPSALNGQPWKFHVVTDIELIALLDDQIKVAVEEAFHSTEAAAFLKSANPIFHGAPLVIFITANRKNEWAALDVGMCAQNIMLAAKALGLDTCAVGLAKLVGHTSIYRKLGIGPDEEVFMSIAAGYGDEKPVAPARKQGNAHFVKYDKANEQQEPALLRINR